MSSHGTVVVVAIVAARLVVPLFLFRYFVFPNTFEYFFMAYEVVRIRWDPSRLSRGVVAWLVVVIWVVIKLPQEWDPHRPSRLHRLRWGSRVGLAHPRRTRGDRSPYHLVVGGIPASAR